MKPPIRQTIPLGRSWPWVCKTCAASFSTTAIRTAKTKAGRYSVPETPARTRFAPSPTGYLHLGSLRTALFNYLLAKRTGGQFLLRIEDTDQKRTIPGVEQRLYDDLRWAGLQWDEGPVNGGPYGPYRQSERTALYSSQVQTLVSSGHAYRCFCTPERLDALARHRHGLGLEPGYDGTCRSIPKAESDDHASQGEQHVVRLRVTEPYPLFDDMVYGKTGQNRGSSGVSSEETVLDPILLKSDGHPTYHLANVVDDHHMAITHVIRGTEWMASTPMHVALYKAFNWEPPQFGHVPLLVDTSGQKLSKRNADIDVSHFRDETGILAGALVNFAALLGWSHALRSDVFGLNELEQTFDLKLTKGNATVAFEKLWFLQKAHARQHASTGGPEFDDMVARVSAAAERTFDLQQISPILESRSLQDYIAAILREGGARSYTTADECAAQNKSFFTRSLNRPEYTPPKPKPKSTPKRSSSTDTTTTTSSSSNNDNAAGASIIPLPALHTAAAALSLVPPSLWTADTHRASIAAYTYSPTQTHQAQHQHQHQQDQTQTFRKELYHYLRWALSAGEPGIGIPATMEILGRDETLRRLDEARALTSSGSDDDRSRNGVGDLEKGGRRESREWMGSLAGVASRTRG